MKLPLAAIAILLASTASAQDVGQAPAGATVRFEGNGKIASGVHIGHGFILTAEHVVDRDKTLTFQLDNGKTEHTATVLWSNYDYDVALVYSPVKSVDKADLACRTPAVGETVLAVGNLNGHRFFKSPGYVSTGVEEIDRWKEVYAVSGANGGGMSGGPVLDKDGQVVGLTVAGPGRIGPYGLIVPGSAICKLMGRVP